MKFFGVKKLFLSEMVYMSRKKYRFVHSNDSMCKNISYFALVLKKKAAACFGEMLEWLKRHAWKACKLLKGFAGSNPAFSASRMP